MRPGKESRANYLRRDNSAGLSGLSRFGPPSKIPLSTPPRSRVINLLNEGHGRAKVRRAQGRRRRRRVPELEPRRIRFTRAAFPSPVVARYKIQPPRSLRRVACARIHDEKPASPAASSATSCRDRDVLGRTIMG